LNFHFLSYAKIIFDSTVINNALSSYKKKLSFMQLADLRQDYKLRALELSDVATDPITQFETWFQEALNSDLLEPNAMVLATATADGMPSARVVLLKGVNEQGFVFYTNYESQKGQALAENPKAALVFNWLELQRQIRIQGSVEKVEDALSISYYQSRPKSSQIGAWSSPQSQVIASRAILEQKELELQAQYAETETLPRPPHWGGYRVRPTVIEFWQGRSSRLHDRVRYRLEEGAWIVERLAP
jgi:pyridoxamine 5'-phosphate oxidase